MPLSTKQTVIFFLFQQRDCMFGSSLRTFVQQGVHVLSMLIVFIYEWWCPTRFPYQIMFLSFSSNTTNVTSGTGTANPSGAQEFTLVLVVFLLLCVVFFRIIVCTFPFVNDIVDLSFDLRLRIAILVSSNLSFKLCHR